MENNLALTLKTTVRCSNTESPVLKLKAKKKEISVNTFNVMA